MNATYDAFCYLAVCLELNELGAYRISEVLAAPKRLTRPGALRLPAGPRLDQSDLEGGHSHTSKHKAGPLPCHQKCLCHNKRKISFPSSHSTTLLIPSDTNYATPMMQIRTRKTSPVFCQPWSAHLPPSVSLSPTEAVMWQLNSSPYNNMFEGAW